MFDLQQLFKDQAMNMFQSKVQEMFGMEVAQDKSILDKALGAVMGQLGKNATDASEAENIMAALDKHTNSGVNMDVNDGKSILSHIFGNNESEVESRFSEKTKLGAAESKDLLALASSFVMENLGNAKAEGNIDKNSISGLTSVAGNFLDKDGDGSVMDDLFDMGKKMFM